MPTFYRTLEKPIGSILCVDDDDDDASLLEMAVSSRHSGIRFIKCPGGYEALELLTSSVSKPDVILLDLNMPLLNGFECLREIRRHASLKDIPVVVLSTSAHPGDVTRAIKLGAYKFLTKPSSYGEICQMMNEIVNEHLMTR
jgi:CheY-like chemotaxis protein